VAASVGYLQIRAPFDGVITSRNVNSGAYVGPAGKGSDQPLLVLQQQSRLRLVVSVPEIYTGSLKNKQEVTFSVKALPNQKFTAKISRLAGALDEKLRSERLEMDVYNKDKKLLPGMFAEVELSHSSRDSTFIVPKTAVVTSTEKVFVVKVINHKAQWVNVQKGLVSGDKMEVYGDIHPGDALVNNATDEIRDGQTVKDTVANKPKLTAKAQ
jgi:RND family efflux transporter MFP subunit